MVVLGVVFAAASLFLSRLVSPSKPTPEKLAPYESGIVPEVEPVERFPVKFYLVAMLFVIFDIEIIFLFAWATRFSELGWVGVGTIAVFVALAIETLIYVWKRGALDWNPPRRERYVRETEEAA
ncbi:MAG: NADH-quinone oxidoreductase subunit A [Acidimicrobiia bacterium]|nr:NADH-quinone oxidoreductase subunit A [Acidimicrobiia bacterium]